MTNKEKHPCFQPPSNINVKIWRYLDFTKYVSFLDTKSLFFSRSDLLSDPYEGSMSHANIRLRSEAFKDKIIPVDAYTAKSNFQEWIRQWTFINSWHMNEFESAAMWKLYAQSNEAVALQSTYNRLYECVPENIYVGIVNYIDYETEWLPENNAFFPFVHKRKSFKHENELRALLSDIPINDFMKRSTNTESGRLVPVKPKELVEVVYISPSAPEWFTRLVERVTKQYGFTFNVQQSLLSKKPVF